MERKDLTEFDRETIDKEFERSEKFCNDLEEMSRINNEIRQEIQKTKSLIEASKADKPPQLDLLSAEESVKLRKDIEDIVWKLKCLK